MTTRITFRGIDDVRDRLGKKAAAQLRRAIDNDIDEGIHEMAETSYDYAPVDTGALRSSILASVHRENLMEYVYGSHLPYAQRQEYEHKTKKGYFRRSIREHRRDLREKITLTIKSRLSGRRGFS